MPGEKGSAALTAFPLVVTANAMTDEGKKEPPWGSGGVRSNRAIRQVATEEDNLPGTANLEMPFLRHKSRESILPARPQGLSQVT